MLYDDLKELKLLYFLQAQLCSHLNSMLFVNMSLYFRAVARKFYWEYQPASVASWLPQSRREAPRSSPSRGLGPGAQPPTGSGPPDFCEIGGPSVILAIENTNKYVAINM